MKLALPLLAAGCCFGVVPTISSIVVSDVTHNSVRVCFSASPGASWVQLQVGTVSGTYTTQSSPNFVFNSSGVTKTCISIGGLADSTTYYARPTAQPNQTNITDICNVNGCGALEQTFTTPSASIPVAPTAPTAYSVPNPDTSGYTVVRMISGGVGGQCRAAASIGPVTAGDLVQTVLNEITYSTVLEFDQGITCNVPNTGVYNSGYTLTHHASPGGNYIVLRTKSVIASDFPPFGTRTSPTLCTLCATFVSTVQESGCTTCEGQIFLTDYSNGGSQNYIIQNLILTVDQTITTGIWGVLLNFGANNALDYSSDNMVCDRCIIRGSSAVAVDTFQAVKISAIHAAITNSWIDHIWATSNYAQGIFLEPGGTGPYNLDNNYIECACMTIYEEEDTGLLNSANDVTISHNSLYWPSALVQANTFLLRQQIEMKGGHRVLIQGNLIDGCYIYANECPSVFLSGVNNNVSNDGVSDVNMNYNLVRNVATFFDCMGVRPVGTNPNPMNTVIQRVQVSNNWAYNLGYANHFAPGAIGGGLVNSYIYHRPGCQDLTITQNTLGFSDSHDTGITNYDFIPVIYMLGGGATLASGFTHTNNIEYMNVGSSYNGGRIFADDPTTNASYPKLPAIIFNGPSDTHSPASILNSYAVTTTNGTVTPSVTWTGNINICGKLDAGSNSWSDLSSAQCTTWQTGMPGTDTWATGNTIALREASVGFNPTTGICSGCSGAGVNIATLYNTMGIVQGITATPSITSATFLYTAPDTRNCSVDIYNSSWVRTNDGGGSVSRSLVVSGLSAATLYQYRILCYFSQTSPLFSGAQITDGNFTTSTPLGLTCDLNNDGVRNVLDIQLQTNQGLGVLSCTNNLKQTGTCNIIDIQRVVTAALGGACNVSP